MIDASLAELVEFGIFSLPFHPVVEFVEIVFLVFRFRIAEILAFGRHDDFRQRFQLAFAVGDGRS